LGRGKKKIRNSESVLSKKPFMGRKKWGGTTGWNTPTPLGGAQRKENHFLKVVENSTSISHLKKRRGTTGIVKNGDGKPSKKKELREGTRVKRWPPLLPKGLERRWRKR